MNKSNLLKLIMAVGMLAVIITSTLIIAGLKNETTGGKKSEFVFESNSDLVSTNPSTTAGNFIQANGTMGNLKEVNEEFFKTFQSETNADKRLKAYNLAKEAIIIDSPLLSSRTEQNISSYMTEFPEYYEIRDLKVSEPINQSKFKILHDGGEVEYDSVEVLVDFTSAKNTLYWPTDVSGESVITQKEAIDEFKNVKVTLVKSGELWFVYDVEDSEHKLNVRMSTWQGRGKDNFSIEQKEIAIYEMDYISEGLEEDLID